MAMEPFLVAAGKGMAKTTWVKLAKRQSSPT
jgi:hypothetical protein